MANRDIITIGASAGGVEPLITLVGALPADLPASIFVVLHLAPEEPSVLAELMGRRAALSVETATDRLEFQPGRVYVAPPDRHLMIDRSYAYLTRGPRENLSRPAVDPLFRSAAVVHGPHVVAVILSGSLDDGTSGLGAVKRCGGVAVVQDPDDAQVPDMPRSAAEHVEVDFCVPLAEMAELLVRLAGDAPGDPVPPSPGLLMEVEMARAGGGPSEQLDDIGDLAALTCEACGGPLWEIRNEKVLRFRCREGHSYTAKTLLQEQKDGIEQSLWAAVQMMDERVRVLERLVAYDKGKGRKTTLSGFQARARETKKHADSLRQFLLTLNQQ
jgi:two-component system chemotaxis response regulator CheB